jgi:hypothetical protein
METQHWIALVALAWSITTTLAAVLIGFAFRISGRVTVVETKMTTLGDFLRMEGRMDLMRGERPLVERNSPLQVVDIVKLQAQYGIDVRAEPRYWTVFRQLYLEPKILDIFDLMAGLKKRIGEDDYMSRALRYHRSAIGYAEFWGIGLEEARRDGLASFLAKFGLTEEEYTRLADAGEAMENGK